MGATEAADAILKTANVGSLRRGSRAGGLKAIIVFGTIDTAVEAGAVAAGRMERWCQRISSLDLTKGFKISSRERQT